MKKIQNLLTQEEREMLNNCFEAYLNEIKTKQEQAQQFVYAAYDGGLISDGALYEQSKPFYAMKDKISANFKKQDEAARALRNKIWLL